MNTRIVILAKAPLPGMAKTRLIPALGEQGAARLAERMLHHTLGQAVSAESGVVELCVAPSADLPVWQSVQSIPVLSEQGEGDLGQRMARIAQRVTSAGEAVLLIGTDCPGLSGDTLRAAASALRCSDAVMVPANDGGYVLLGLNRYAPELFHDIPWSTERVAELTRQRIATLGWTLFQLDPLHDIDAPSDLVYLPAYLRTE